MTQPIRPSVVFIMSDQHRWDFMSYESNGCTLTQNLAKLGRDGVIFHAASCCSKSCSHGSMNAHGQNRF